MAQDGKLDDKMSPKGLLEGYAMAVMAKGRPCGKQRVILEPVIRELSLVQTKHFESLLGIGRLIHQIATRNLRRDNLTLKFKSQKVITRDDTSKDR